MCDKCPVLCKWQFSAVLCTHVETTSRNTLMVLPRNLINWTLQRIIFNKTNQTHQFPKFYFVIKLYMFRVFPLSIIRRFLLYIRHPYISCRFDDNFQAGSGCSIPTLLGNCSSPQNGHITFSYTPYRQLENQSTKYHRQQPTCILLSSSWWWA